jgi:sugar phosphate isomerase/epimerase
MQVNTHSRRLGDVDAIVERCRQLKVRNVLAYRQEMPGVAETGAPDVAALRAQVGRLNDVGIEVPVAAMRLSRDPDVVLDLVQRPEAHRREIDAFCRSFEAIGAAGIPTVLHLIDLRQSQDPAEDDALWAALIRVHREFVGSAERGGVRIANHAIWRCLPDDLRPQALADAVTIDTYRSYHPTGWDGPFLLSTAEDVKRLVDAVPSPNNGVCFCTGMYISGGDLEELTDVFAGKIFYSQVRDTRGRWPAAEEAFPGTGDLDFHRIFVKMRRAGYDGLIGPEHLGKPRFAGDDLEAGAVAYYQGVLADLERADWALPV